MTHATPYRSDLFESQLSPYRKELFSSGELNFKKTELSMEQVASPKDSFLNENGSEQVEFVSAELDALDLSIIPADVRSASVLKASVLDESQRVDNPINLKPLVLESTGIKTNGWCKSCVVCQGKEVDGCQVM